MATYIKSSKLEVWACSESPEHLRTYGFLVPPPRLGKTRAHLFCSECKKLTLHQFTGQHTQVPMRVFLGPTDHFKVGKPASQWKFKPQSAQKAGFSRAANARGSYYSMERR